MKGLFTATPTPLIEQEPLLQTNRDARIQIGCQPNELTMDDAANLSGCATASGSYHRYTLPKVQEAFSTTWNAPTGRDCLAANTAQAGT